MPDTAVATPKQGEAEIVKAYTLAQKLAPGVIKKHNLGGQIDVDDLVGDFIQNFIEKGFMDKFNPKVMSFDRYIWMGLRNSGIQAARRHKERTSVQAMGAAGDGGDFVPAAKEAPKSHELLGELIDDIEDFEFGRGEVAKVPDADGNLTEVPSTAKGLLTMLSMGFKPFEVAQRFGVSPGTISGQMKRIKAQLKVRYPDRFVEAVLPVPSSLALFDATVRHLFR